MKNTLLLIALLNVSLTGLKAQNPPTADFTCTVDSFVPSTICCINFIDLSTDTPTTWWWSFGDGVDDTLQNPTHCYYSVGGYGVILFATNGFGTDTLCKAYPYIIFDSTGCYCPEDTILVGTGNNINALKSISIYPNPFTDFTRLTFENSRKSIYSINVYNIEGKLVKTVANLKARSTVLFRGNLPSGMYWVEVVGDDGIIGRKKVIVQ